MAKKLAILREVRVERFRQPELPDRFLFVFRGRKIAATTAALRAPLRLGKVRK
jgi:hypothetical protein